MEELIKRAKEKGIDVEDVLIREISKEDPQEGIKLRLEIAEKYMNEAYEYLKKVLLFKHLRKLIRLPRRLQKL